MSAIAEFQFELLPDLVAIDGQVFGIGSEISANEDGFHPGSTDWATQDTVSGATGVTNFGRDKLLGPVWAWDLHVNRDEVENAVESLEDFVTAWRALQIRELPGAVIPLRYRLAGRERRIYGRPGKVEASINNLLLSGFTPITCDFQAVNAYTYDDVETSAILSVTGGDAGASGGGFLFPLTFPYGSQPATEQATRLVVGGSAPTQGVYRFNGPWDSPGIAASGWTISLPDYSIPSGSYVEVDTRPWANTVLLNGIASVAGKIGRRQSLSAATLKPGPLDVSLLGSSPNGTATCQVRWSNAYNSL